MKIINAFQWREFVQPVLTVPECLKRGQPSQFITDPRQVIKGDAADTRVTINSAGRFVQTKMHSHKPSLSVAVEADQKVMRVTKAAI